MAEENKTVECTAHFSEADKIRIQLECQRSRGKLHTDYDPRILLRPATLGNSK